MKSQRLLCRDLAGIQYIGLTGITSSCITAITRLINGGEFIRNAHLITCGADHAFLLITEREEVIAVKAGFSSGYSGEGPSGLATALMLLYRHKVEIEEYIVEPPFLERLEYSCLLQDDLNTIENQIPVRPRKWYDYVYERGKSLELHGRGLSHHYPLTLPFGLIDERIIDLAVSFYENEDAAIIAAYRRLEDILRDRTGLAGEGTRLFSRAFIADDSPLRWDVPDEGEAKGRGNIFIATYMAFRNARVHRELSFDSDAMLREFLLVNELYRLEAESMTESELKAKRETESTLKADMLWLQSKIRT